MRLVVVASQESEVVQNSANIWTYSSSRSSNVNHRPWCQPKAHMQLPISSNLGCISYCFWDINT